MALLADAVGRGAVVLITIYGAVSGAQFNTAVSSHATRDRLEDRAGI